MDASILRAPLSLKQNRIWGVFLERCPTAGRNTAITTVFNYCRHNVLLLCLTTPGVSYPLRLHLPVIVVFYEAVIQTRMMIPLNLTIGLAKTLWAACRVKDR